MTWVTATPDALHVVDWKSARTKWNPDRVAENAAQLLLYRQTMGAMARGMNLPVQLHIVVVTKQKTPQIQIFDVPGDTGRAAAVRDGVAQVWAAMQAGNYYENPAPATCAMCAFKSRCPVFAGK